MDNPRCIMDLILLTDPKWYDYIIYSFANSGQSIKYILDGCDATHQGLTPQEVFLLLFLS
jgi:hypothetical protein